MEVPTITKVYAGDTSDVWEVGFVVSEPGIEPKVLADLDGNFTCHLSVKDAAPAINRQIVTKTNDNKRFRAWLTPAETLALAKGRWLVGIEIRNPTLTPALVKERQLTIKVETPAVPPA